MPFEFRPLPRLPDVVLVEPRRFSDERGWFMETYRRREFAANGIPHEFVQDNHSRSTMAGVLRGLHFQKDPRAQGKLVRVLRGRVFDVAVDIRKGSPTYGVWDAVELDEADGTMLWVPPGFLHGFCTLTEVADVVYKVTADYDGSLDRSVRWDDPAIGIAWPVRTPSLSKKDATAPLLADVDNEFTWGARS